MKIKTLAKWLLLLVLTALFAGASLAAAEGNVAKVGDVEYVTLQAAIDAVPQSGSIIVLLQNTTESIDTQEKSFTLDMSGYTLTAASGQRAYTQTGGTVTVKNGTITGGSASGSGDDGRGGGVYITGGTLTMDSVTIWKNNASVDGGGLYADDSTITLEYCRITENVASGEAQFSTITAGGGGIALHTGVTLTATNTNILQNEATNGTGSGIAIGIGEVYLGDAANTVALNSCEISDNIAWDEDGGSAVMLDVYSILEATALEVSRNKSSVTGSDSVGGLDIEGKATLHNDCIVTDNQGYIGGIRVHGARGILIAEEGLIVDGNSGNFAGGMYVDLSTGTMPNIGLKGTIFKENTATGNDGAGGLYFRSLGATTFSLENCEFTNNTGATGALFANNQGAQLTIRNCAFSGNTGTQYAGAITEMMRGKWLNLYGNTITNNTGYKAGGLYGRYVASHNYGINLGSGNIVYNNTSMDGNGGNDIAIDQTRYTSLLAASSMGNSAPQFAGWTWIGGTGTTTLSVGESISSSSSYYKAPNTLYFTAGVPNEVAQNVTNNDKPTYYTLQNAITSAASGDTIRLIGEKDDLVESVIVNKEITLDLNDHDLSGVSGAALTVEAAGNLTLTGTGGVSRIKNAGGQVTVNDNIPIDELILAEHSFMTVGSAFAPNAMEIVLDDDVLQSLNNGYQSDSPVVVTLLVPLAGETLNPALLNSVTVKGVNGYVSIEMDGGKLVARSGKLGGVYVNGETGSDTNSGLSAASPVKTFAHAKEVLEANSDATGIYVMGQLTVSNSEIWTLPAGKSLIRYPNYFGYLVEVSGMLTLQDIVMDGSSQQKVSASAALVHVTQNGVLNIENGAVLQNNNHAAGNYTMPGGAVYGSGGTVNMSGGVIEGNSSWFGGGIAMNGGLLNLTGGSIRTNSAKDRYDFHAIGGGIALLNDARMNMDGGTISDNSSENIGGGIAVGGVNSYTIGKATLNMTGGEISGNVSAWEGGGVYIQSEAVGTILGGMITGNRSNQGYFGGGGIYVNGARVDTDGESFAQGELYLQNVIITGNSAPKEGGGLAACASSMTNIYVSNGAAIYDNQGGDGAQQIYIDGGLVTTIYGSTPHAVVSGHMLDGTPYHWTDRNGNPIPLDTLSRISGTSRLNNDHTADKTGLGRVLITGNSSDTRGGGIGSNGYVQIGLVPTEGAWTPEATKTLIGRDMAEQEFTFEVKDENGNVVSTGYNLAAANGQPAQIVFTPISFDGQAIGTQLTYTITEVQTSLPAYVTGDANSFTVDVTVIEGSDGKLTGAVSSESPAVAFQNVYTPMEGAWTPLGTKTLIGRDMAQGEFAFVVTENGNVVSTGYNVAATDDEPAQILFTPISFVGDVAGTTHTYVITEVLDNLPAGVTGDPTSYTVEVTVTEGADGRLNGVVTAASPTVSFHNTYVPSDGEWTPEGTKTLIGRSMIQGEFRFEVHENGRLVSNGYAQAAGDSEAARIIFTPISLNSESVGSKHTYVITEKQDVLPMGVTGDRRSYTVEVTIELGADGRLMGKVSASSPEVHFENRFDPPIADLPQTGDDSHIGLWSVLALLSMLGIFVIRMRGVRSTR